MVSSFCIIGFRSYRQKQKKKKTIAQQKLEQFRKEVDLLQSTIESQLGKEPMRLKFAILREDINQYLIDPLTDREKDVLKYISLGKTNKEIGEIIFISENTVKYHLQNKYKKLGATNQTQACMKMFYQIERRTKNQ